MAKSPEEMAAAMVANMPAKTGKSLEQWLAIVKKSKLEKHGEIVKLLKGEPHGIGHGYANMVAHHALNPVEGNGDDLVAAQYAGEKAALRPIYEALIALAKKLGKDVEIAPKKTCVSLRRSKQFALVQPSTKTRVDLGINMKGEPPSGRLEASGSFNSMVSHRVRLTDVREVDAELAGWLKAAYEAS